MKPVQFYAQILGIKAPWRVEDVSVSWEEKEVRVSVGMGAGKLKCPECGRICSGYDRRVRRWRHLDTCQLKTVVEAEVPRVEYSEHGARTVLVPWAERGSRFTAMFEALVISWLKEASILAVSRQLQLSEKAVFGIQARAVKRGLSRRKSGLVKRVGVDETSFAKRHEYVTVVSEQGSGGRVLHVAAGRDTASLVGYLEGLSEEERAGMESVSMARHAPYIKAVRQMLAQWRECIAFDKFHVAKYLGEAVDLVRRQENRSLREAGDDSLKGSKYSWLRNPDKMSSREWKRFAFLLRASLKTSRAWAIKELAMGLWDYCTRGWALRAWKKWLAWASRSRLLPVRKVAATIRRHLWGIINAIIQRLKSKACGYRNRENFRNAIYFHLGGLDLYPTRIGENHPLQWT